MLAGLSLLVASAACSRRDSVRIIGPDSKQFPLRTIDGHALPYQISQAGATTTTVVNDMLLTMVSDDTWTTVGHETVTTNGTPAQVVVRGSGSFAATTNGTETFRDAGGVTVWTGQSVPPSYVLTDTLGMAYLFGP